MKSQPVTKWCQSSETWWRPDWSNIIHQNCHLSSGAVHDKWIFFKQNYKSFGSSPGQCQKFGHCDYWSGLSPPDQRLWTNCIAHSLYKMALWLTIANNVITQSLGWACAMQDDSESRKSGTFRSVLQEHFWILGKTIGQNSRISALWSDLYR